MKKVLTRIALGATLFTAVTGYSHAAGYSIDNSHTYPQFTISHLGFSTMHGRFNKTEGTLSFDEAKKTGAVDIKIDVSSIDTGHAKRDKHLRSPDFFNAKEFPSITFKSKSAKLSGGKGNVTGDLTIMGTTKSVTLDVSSYKCGVHPFNKKEVCGFDASTQIKRSDFGMKYGLPAIGDDVTLTISIEAVKG